MKKTFIWKQNTVVPFVTIKAACKLLVITKNTSIYERTAAKSILHPSHRLRQHHLRWRQHHLRWKQHHFRWKQHHFLSIFTIFCRFSPFFIDFHNLRTFVAIYILSRFTHFFSKFFFWPKQPSPQHHTFFACMHFRVNFLYHLCPSNLENLEIAETEIRF